jgi:hypothetical protein
MPKTYQHPYALYDWRLTANQFILTRSSLRLTTNNVIFKLNTCGCSFYVTSSLRRGWVCRLQLLVLATAVILRSEARGSHYHILIGYFHKHKIGYINQVQQKLSARVKTGIKKCTHMRPSTNVHESFNGKCL